MDKKRILAAIYASALAGAGNDEASIGERLGLEADEVERELGVVEKQGLVERGVAGPRLTKKGRREIRVVFIGGGFEVIHYGHAYTIAKAKGLGDVLVVSVARDSTIRKRKKREPLVGEEDRARLVSALKDVDVAVLGVEGDIYVTLLKVSPDVVALGYDQHHIEDEVRKEAARRGLEVTVVRLDSPYPGIKTSRVLNEL